MGAGARRKRAVVGMELRLLGRMPSQPGEPSGMLRDELRGRRASQARRPRRQDEGNGEPRPRAAVPAQMWEGRARSRNRCGRGEPGPGTDVGGGAPSPRTDVAPTSCATANATGHVAMLRY